MRSLTSELPSQQQSRESVTKWWITCAVGSPGLPSWVCGLNWTLSAEVLEGGAEEGRTPPPAGAAGLGRGGLAAMAGLGGRGPAGRLGRAGFRWRGAYGWMGSTALIGCLGSAGNRERFRLVQSVSKKHGSHTFSSNPITFQGLSGPIPPYSRTQQT